MGLVNVAALAKETQSQINRLSYGAIRRKLDKNGFSEIALYQAVNNHCLENDIAPAKMAKDMLELLKGCADNVFFPKTSDKFHYLRGSFHDLRMGNLDRDEPKAPEQRGLFLCNRCFLVKKESERSPRKNERYTCDTCAKEASRLSAKRYHQKMKEQPPAAEAHIKEMPLTIAECEVKEENHDTKPKFELMPHKESVKVSEIIADESSGASITIKCGIDQVAEVIMAVKSV